MTYMHAPARARLYVLPQRLMTHLSVAACCVCSSSPGASPSSSRGESPERYVDAAGGLGFMKLRDFLDVSAGTPAQHVT